MHSGYQWLKGLLIACIVSTAIHFTDNYLYIQQYPQPAWVTPSSIYTAWITWTAIGILGYWLYRSQRLWLSYACLVVYSWCGLDSLAHYFYGSMSEFSVKMHIFIVTDGLTGAALLAFLLWSIVIRREPFNGLGRSA